MSEPSVEQQRILVVDDEEYLTDLLSTSFRFHGFEVETAANGFEALNKARAFEPDLIVLDVKMPDIDGLEVCRRLRAGGNNVPVIFLTARDTKADLLAGFAIGGDDYIMKPFSLEEVVVRIRAVLKRATIGAAEPELLEYTDVVMDETTYVVTRAGREIDLSPTEWRLLRYLLMNAERVLSKQQILSYVWHYDFGGEESSVETYISYLRKKLDHENDPLIHTLRGVGYTLRSRARLELTRFGGHLILDVSRGEGGPDGSSIEVSRGVPPGGGRAVRSSDRPRCQVAESLGISDGSLAAWVKEADAADEPGALDADERAELARLRKENAELRMDREILRKAAAYFARETTR